MVLQFISILILLNIPPLLVGSPKGRDNTSNLIRLIELYNRETISINSLKSIKIMLHFYPIDIMRENVSFLCLGPSEISLLIIWL